MLIEDVDGFCLDMVVEVVGLIVNLNFVVKGIDFNSRIWWVSEIVFDIVDVVGILNVNRNFFVDVVICFFVRNKRYFVWIEDFWKMVIV